MVLATLIWRVCGSGCCGGGAGWAGAGVGGVSGVVEGVPSAGFSGMSVIGGYSATYSVHDAIAAQHGRELLLHGRMVKLVLQPLPRLAEYLFALLGRHLGDHHWSAVRKLRPGLHGLSPARRKDRRNTLLAL